MRVLIAVVLFAVFATGCASGGNQAYTAAHKSASDRGIAEANARAEADKTLSMAAASIGKSCQEDVCRMGALMTLSALKAAAGAAIQSAAPAIAAPVNEALEWAKVLVPGAIAMHSNHLGAVLGIVNSTKGSADKDVAGSALTSITPVAPWATPAP